MSCSRYIAQAFSGRWGCCHPTNAFTRQTSPKLTLPSVEGGSNHLRRPLRYLLGACSRNRSPTNTRTSHRAITPTGFSEVRSTIGRGWISRLQELATVAEIPDRIVLAVVSAPDAPPHQRALLVWRVQTVRSRKPGPAARVPIILTGVLGCIAIFACGALIQNDRVGVIAAILLMLNPLFRLHAHRAMSNISVRDVHGGGDLAFLVGMAAGLVRTNWPGFVAAQLSAQDSPPVWHSSANSTASSP